MPPSAGGQVKREAWENSAQQIKASLPVGHVRARGGKGEALLGESNRNVFGFGRNRFFRTPHQRWRLQFTGRGRRRHIKYTVAKSFRRVHLTSCSKAKTTSSVVVFSPQPGDNLFPLDEHNQVIPDGSNFLDTWEVKKKMF